MRIVIAGGHGKIALLLERLLAERGDQAVGLIRNPAHVADVRRAGAEAFVCDLETASADDVALLLSGADAVVFAAGAGAGSGAPRKDSVDRAASVLMADAAERARVRRFVQISSMGAGTPPRPGTDEVLGCLHYGENRRRGRSARPGPGLDHPAPGRPHRRSRHRQDPARTPAGPSWHGPPRRCRRGHCCPARRTRYPAPDARADRRRQPGRRGRAQHFLITVPGTARPASPPSPRSPG